jgi:hypothetical protein
LKKGTLKSTLIGDLSLAPETKISHSMTKEERELIKMKRILELERKRTEDNLRKLEYIEYTGEQKQRMAEEMRKKRED